MKMGTQTGFTTITAATGALVVVAITIRQVYESGVLPVGDGAVSHTGFLLTVGVVLALWSLAVVIGLQQAYKYRHGENNAD